VNLDTRGMENRGVRLHDKSLNFVTGQIRPLREKIVLKPLPPALSQTIAADWNGEAVRGQVIAIGPGTHPRVHSKGIKDGKPYRTVRDLKAFRPCDVKVGDIVHLGGMEIGGYLWPHILIDGEDHILCSEQDVCGVELA
jgi:co-chaperonin GroES (HSP10)